MCYFLLLYVGVGMANNFQCSALEMAELWETHSLNKNISELNDVTIHAFRNFLQQQQKRKELPQQQTPQKKIKVSTTTPPSTIFSHRTNVGQIVTTHSPSTAPTGSINDSTEEVKVEVMSGLKNVVRGMHTPMSVMANVLQEKMVAVESENTVDVGVPSMEEIVCVGRICNEAHIGKLNSTALLLEGSNGIRIPLTMSPPYSLFPGQIVALQGTNPTGRHFHATSLLSLPQTPNTTTTTTENGVKMVLVAGPYTTSDNFEYEPFNDLIHSVVQEEDPSIVILMGPFVPPTFDWTLPTEESKEVLVTKETLFFERISCQLQDYVQEHSSSKVQFVLVPSVEDALGTPMMPQPPLNAMEERDQDSLGLEDRVICVPNPCTLRINDSVTIGLTSTDVLQDLCKEEIHAGMELGNRLPRLAHHLLTQQSFYPLFPSHPPIDYQYFDHMRIPTTPDILLLPSKLHPFCKPTDPTNHTMAINPGHLTKGRVGGTYAIVNIYPSTSKLPITDRLTAEIKRI